MTKASTNVDIKVDVNVIATKTHIRVKDILLLHEKGIIDLNDPDIYAILTPISRLWHSNFFLKRMLSYRSRSVRSKLVETADLTRPEQHAYARFMSGDVNDRNLWKEVFAEIVNFYRVRPEKAEEIVRRMALKVRRKRYYQKSKNREVI
jgi:hypothetical protein